MSMTAPPRGHGEARASECGIVGIHGFPISDFPNVFKHCVEVCLGSGTAFARPRIVGNRDIVGAEGGPSVKSKAKFLESAQRKPAKARAETREL